MAKSRRPAPPAELPAGAKVLATRIEGAGPPPPKIRKIGPNGPSRARWDGPILSPGTLVAEFAVEGRAVPWKATRYGRNGGVIPNPAVKAWVAIIRKAAALAMIDREPYGGPVELRLTFHLTPARNGCTPDLCNTTKLLEDAIQGPVIVNDSAVRSHRNRRVIDDRDYVTVKVIAD